MSGSLAAGVVAGYGVALPVGAIATYLVALGARAPFRVAAAAAFGVASTDGAFALVAGLGGAGLQRALAPAAGTLTVAAALVIACLGVRTLCTELRRSRDGAATARIVAAPSAIRAYAGMLAATAVNPATLGYFVALVVGGGLRFAAPATALFGTGAFAASASWQLLLAGGGVTLGRVVTTPRAQLAVAAVSSAIMFALAVRTLGAL